MTSLLAAIFFASICGIWSANSQPANDLGDYLTSIQPIFDKRCVACHSCYNAPCQLNLQNYSGVMRGASKLNVYDGSRPKSVAPPVSISMVTASPIGVRRTSSMWSAARIPPARC
jgi:hypothetical protein